MRYPAHHPNIHLLFVGPDIEIENLHREIVAAPGFTGQRCMNVDEASVHLTSSDFDVALIDVSSRNSGVSTFLDEGRHRFPGVALIVIADSQNIDLALRAASAGAADFLVRPLHTETAIVRIHHVAAILRMERRLDEQRMNLETSILARIEELKGGLDRVERTSEELVHALGHALGLRDNETVRHCHRVARYSLEVADAFGCTAEQVRTIMRGAFLHDIGKIGIPDAILHKPGPLTPEERKVMETHVRIGYEMVRRLSLLAPAAEIVLTHHERFDGLGYPQGLRGDEVPIGSRIFSVVDTFDAMTSSRPYRQAQSYKAARQEIIEHSGTQFDPRVVQAFLSIPESAWARIREEVKAILGSDPYRFFRRASESEE